jgi:hypothetical protein
MVQVVRSAWKANACSDISGLDIRGLHVSQGSMGCLCPPHPTPPPTHLSRARRVSARPAFCPSSSSWAAASVSA